MSSNSFLDLANNLVNALEHSARRTDAMAKLQKFSITIEFDSRVDTIHIAVPGGQGLNAKTLRAAVQKEMRTKKWVDFHIAKPKKELYDNIIESMPKGVKHTLKRKKLPKPGKLKTGPSTFSPLGLLNTINRNLLRAITANMHKPTLVYRWGTFAKSVKATLANYTADGSVLVQYDYEHKPYGVFDRSFGKYPWMTPQRNVQDLVERSIRGTMKELVTAKMVFIRQ